MDIDFSNINLLAVLLAALAYFILGALWFTPLFGKQYDEALGTKRDKKQKWPAIYYVGPFLSSLAAALGLAAVISLLGISSLGDAITLGLLAGVGFALSISMNNAINPITPKPIKYGLVTGLYHVVGFILASIIIVTL